MRFLVRVGTGMYDGTISPPKQLSDEGNSKK